MESVMDMARGAFGGETLKRISSWLGESPEGTRAAMQDALPASLVGVANQAASEEGSQALLNRLQKGDYPRLDPDDLGRAGLDRDRTEQLVQSSQGFMGGLFGGKLGGLIDGVAEHAGISRSAVSKLLALATPLMMSLIGKRAASEHLDAAGLRSYLGQQRNIATNLLPGSLSRLLAPAGAAAAAATGSRLPHARVMPAVESRERREGFPWWIAGLLALIALGAFAWNRVSHRRADRRPAVTQVAAPMGTISAGDVGALSLVLEGSSALPERLLIKNLTFDTDSAAIDPASRQVLDEVAGVLANHPTAKIRVEGHTDTTGAADVNRQLSQARADATKRYLGERGIDANRIEAVGHGAAQPIDTNDNPAGRARNRRTEIVVTAR
jgi:outer membrane protein OmpA-like peptidoglycan-associated protein